MMTLPDFLKKQIVFVFLSYGEKISFLNENLVVKGKDGKTRLQTTCYRIFMLCIVGSFTLTSGVIQRSHKFGFPILLFTSTLRVYDKLGARLEGNVILRRKQYLYNDLKIAKHIIKNKIINQRLALENTRNKTDAMKIAISKLDNLCQKVDLADDNLQHLLALEGNAAKIYFTQHFESLGWKGRKPRIKSDYINSLLDIGYTLLFNIIDALLNIYGFDVYCGIFHKEFYMRKSLVCDLVEPFRPIIDVQVKKSINLKQFKVDDFYFDRNTYKLNYEASKKYILIFLQAILKYKEDLFTYVQSYYRSFMKEKDVSDFPVFILS